ncbi:MAG: serine hydrolase [Acidimicrobiia bacterium]
MSDGLVVAWPADGWAALESVPDDIDAKLLRAAVKGALDRETVGPRDMTSYLRGILAGQSHAELLGPLRDAVGASGVIVYRGSLLARWGDPAALEMSFSATKTYLSVVAGAAFDHDLIGDLDDPVAASVDGQEFAAPLHDQTTWAHLLHQSSEWSGTLWDKPWWADPQDGQPRNAPLGAPGSVFAYNDVRINLLALALTRLWRRPVPEVLRAEVMEPIEASSTWEWHGYRNSRVQIDGQPIEVVSGGAHWGGGLWMNAYDHARLGYLFLRRGRWRSRQILSDEWIDASTTPSPTNPDYGMLWWLNRRARVFPDAPTSGFCARGNLGRQLVWVDPARDLVVVSRWSDDVGILLAEVSRAICSTG